MKLFVYSIIETLAHFKSECH